MKSTTRLAYKLLSPPTWSLIVQDWKLARRRLTNHRQRAPAPLEGQCGLRLHHGCGKRATPAWVNVDAYENPGLDLRWDLRNPLPVDAGAVDLLYSEHVLEDLRHA